MRLRRSLPVLLIAALSMVAASCAAPVRVDGEALDERGPTPTPPTSDASPPPSATTPTPAPTPDPDATPTPQPVTVEPGDRIWIVDGNGALSTVRPDGSDVVTLTPDSAAGETFVDSQPVWSPDADRLAWVRTDPVSGDSWLVSSRADRSGSWQAPASAEPFYLQWDPSSSRIAALGAGDGGFEISVADISAGATPSIVDRGTPYWFSWGPTGDELLVHASGVRLDRVALDGGTIIVEEVPADFQTPVWTESERALIYADEVDEVQYLVAAGREGQGRRPLVRYDGYLQFVVGEASNRIALQVLAESPFPVPEVVTAGLPTTPRQDEPLDPVDSVERDRLVVIPTFGGEAFEVSDVPSLAFFWSPDGSTLAWLQEVDELGAGLDPDLGGRPRDTPRWMRWYFWDGTDLWTSPDFVPTDTFVDDYLPLFDQQAQSLTFFSPDAGSFVYTGTDRSGVSGVWVLPMARFAEPQRIAAGEIAAWSPTTAGSAAANAP